MSVDDLRPTIVSILEHSDLTQISSKAVRTMLSQQYSNRIPHGIDVDGAHKKEVTALIKECFQRLNDADSQPSATTGLTLPGTGGVPSEVQAGKAKKAKKRAAAVEGDDDELADDPTKSGKKAPRKKKAKRADPDAPKKKRTLNPNNPFNRPLILDEPLRAVCGGVEEAPRYGVTKLIWQYIKANVLQDPNDGRSIICDDKLTALFGKPKVGSFEIAKLLGQHLTPKPIPPGGFPVPKTDEEEEAVSEQA